MLSTTDDHSSRAARGDLTHEEGSVDEASLQADRRGVFMAAIVFLVVTRLYFVLFHAATYTEIPLYYLYASRSVDLGEIPYRDFEIEYPAAAYWLMRVPRALTHVKPGAIESIRDVTSKGEYLATYAKIYKLFMLLCDVGCLLLLMSIVKRRAPVLRNAALWSYLLCTTVLGQVLYERFDAALLLLLLGWVFATWKGTDRSPTSLWNDVAGLLLGLGISLKLIPLVIAPFALLNLWRGSDGGRRLCNCLRQTGMIAVGVFLPILPLLPTAGTHVFDFLRFHSVRGLEIESLPATLIYLFSLVGMEMTIGFSFGSLNVIATPSHFVAQASTFILACTLVVLFAIAWRKARFDAGDATRYGISAILMTLVFSKVLSAQYFLFALPLMIVLAADSMTERRSRSIMAGAVIVALLTTIVFPFCWDTRVPGTIVGVYPDPHPFPFVILAIRNLLYVVLVTCVLCPLIRSR